MSTRDSIAFVTRSTEAHMPINTFVVDALRIGMALVVNATRNDCKQKRTAWLASTTAAAVEVHLPSLTHVENVVPSFRYPGSQTHLLKSGRCSSGRQWAL